MKVSEFAAVTFQAVTHAMPHYQHNMPLYQDVSNALISTAQGMAQFKQSDIFTNSFLGSTKPIQLAALNTDLEGSAFAAPQLFRQDAASATQAIQSIERDTATDLSPYELGELATQLLLLRDRSPNPWAKSFEPHVNLYPLNSGESLLVFGVTFSMESLIETNIVRIEERFSMSLLQMIYNRVSQKRHLAVVQVERSCDSLSFNREPYNDIYSLQKYYGFMCFEADPNTESYHHKDGGSKGHTVDGTDKSSSAYGSVGDGFDDILFNRIHEHVWPLVADAIMETRLLPHL